MRKKYIPFIVVPLVVIVGVFFGCATNPLTGQRHMALVSNSELFPMSFSQYEQFLSENTVVTGTPEAEMVARVGWKIADAAQKWFTAQGAPDYLDGYEWEFNLVQDDTINAWCMPGGKIVFYTGILPITQTEAGLAVVMGHEVSHALLNHGQQRVSADTLQQGGAAAASVVMQILGVPPTVQALGMLGYQAGTTLFGTMPFGREHESEADRYGLTLMAIAGYDPGEAPIFWERMSALGGAGVPQFLSTHPSDATRIRQLQGWIPEAKQRAADFGVRF